ncbi:MAG: Ldh family oxidoreductase [Pseudomonadota bacterium]
MSNQSMTFSVDTLKAFGMSVLHAAGCSEAQANSFVDNLIWADASGRGTHGFWRLPVYVRRFREGLMDGQATPTITNNASALIAIDAANTSGQYAGDIACKHIAERSQQHGIAAATVANSNHFGAAGYFAAALAEQGLIGLVLSNSMPRIAPTGGRRAVFGTNPLAFAAPLGDQQPVLVDFAASAMSGAAIMQMAAAGIPLEEGVAIDADGKPLTDASGVGKGALLPFGAHKGFGIALLVELLSGVLSGAGVSSGVGSMFNDFTRAANTGHCFIAIDPQSIWQDMSVYNQRAKALADTIIAAGAPGEVRLPGANTWKKLAEARDSGITFAPKVTDALAQLASDVGVPALRSVP